MSLLDRLLGRESFKAQVHEADSAQLFVTGESLVQRVHAAIEARQPVLLTGPRGCGKTYCVEEAIRRAIKAKSIGGYHFLQGNREIPRDYLSEDSLVVGANNQLALLDALAIRPPDAATAEEVAERRKKWPQWPGLTPHELSARSHAWARLSEGSLPHVVLFLDEINRFGDGFLDSLLSVVEEGRVVRRGTALYVPVVVLATANPPGYDVTAKRLSPPLQARICRSYRLAQPPLDVIAHTVLGGDATAAKLEEGKEGDALALVYAVSAVILLLWGDPDAGTQGSAFLSPGTRQWLRDVTGADPALARAMRELALLVVFGPDARAARDWWRASVATAKKENVGEVREALRATAVEILTHKVRESFSQSAEPAKAAQLERLIAQVVGRALDAPEKPSDDKLRELLSPANVAAAAKLAGLTGDMAGTEFLSDLADLAERRQRPWIKVLATAVAGSIEPKDHPAVVTSGGRLLYTEDRAFLLSLLTLADSRVAALKPASDEEREAVVEVKAAQRRVKEILDRPDEAKDWHDRAIEVAGLLKFKDVVGPCLPSDLRKAAAVHTVLKETLSPGASKDPVEIATTPTVKETIDAEDLRRLVRVLRDTIDGPRVGQGLVRLRAVERRLRR